MDRVELHQAAGSWMGGIVTGIRDRWSSPTPCPGWDVRTLLNHVVAENLWVDPLLRGATIDEVGDRLEGDQLRPDPVSAYELSVKQASEAFREPGALQRSVHVSYGDIPGDVYCGHRIIDLAVHGWDLAVATDQDRSLPRELADACWGIVEPQLDVLAHSGVFGAPVRVGDHATSQERLLGALGRQP